MATRESHASRSAKQFGGALFQGSNNIAACAAWIPAMTLGLLFADTSIYIGPLANTFGAGTGGYLCFVVAGGLGLLSYPALILLMPSQISRADDVVQDAALESGAPAGAEMA
jgi:hypothetical protein